MKQYNQIKVKYPDALLLFRVGDFYETFGQDAVRASKILGIILTKRGAGSSSETELAGFPHHSLNTYLPKLVRAGCRVAICDQLEDPKLTKTIVKRGVTELVTPGVALNDEVLEHKKNSVVAKRIKRSEGFFFKFAYEVHKIITYILTGKKINFGNFSCLTKEDVETLSNKASLWSSFSGTLKKYINPLNEINSIRGSRYFGPSKMSIFKLIIHSFAIIAVFKNTVFIRSSTLDVSLYTFVLF